MIGAIIGDLAAWTWEQDKEAFFRKLVSSEASSSWMVEELLLTADTLALERGSDIKVHECLGKRQSPVATVMRAIAIGWLLTLKLRLLLHIRSMALLMTRRIGMLEHLCGSSSLYFVMVPPRKMP